MTGKARSKGKERRGKGNGRRYDGRRGGRDGGFAPLLLGGIDATVHIARKPAIRLTHWRQAIHLQFLRGNGQTQHSLTSYSRVAATICSCPSPPSVGASPPSL